MLRKIKLLFVLFYEFVYVVYSTLLRNKVLVYHYNKNNNIGDLIHYELLKHYTDVTPITPKMYRIISKFVRNYLIVGSIIENSNAKSVVIGAGTNDPFKLENKPTEDFGEVKAVRGNLTKSILEKKSGESLNLVLGDPGLLMPRVYNPQNIARKYRFGLVLHYVDADHPIKGLVKGMGGKIISVNQKPKCFIDELLKCDKILSSSMHGIILADAYKIENRRLILSDKIVGADFKFEDYYSTTDEPKKEGIVIGRDITSEEIESILKQTTVSDFKYSLSKLEKLIESIR